MAFKPKNISESQPRPFVECAYAGCQQEALPKVRTPTGLANLCRYHYSRQNLPAAKEYCERHDLVTARDCMAHVKKLLAAPRDYRDWIRRPKSTIAALYADEYLLNHPLREPGQDEEEMAA